MLQKSEVGWRSVRPPGCPSNRVRAWAPWRWIESSPACSGSSWWKVTFVRCPARRRIVGPGKLPPKVQSLVLAPGRICCSASRIPIRTWSSRRTGGIGKRLRKGTAASAGSGSVLSGSRPPPPPRRGRSAARAPPPRAPSRARRPKRGGVEGCPAVPLAGRRRQRYYRSDDVHFALHFGMHRAHEVERGAGLGGDLLGDVRPRLLFTGEPGVALLAAGVAHRAPAGGARLHQVDRDLLGFRVEAVPLGDREADLLRREAGVLRFAGLRQRALGDQREGVRADLFRAGLVDDFQLISGGHRFRTDELQLAFGELYGDRLGGAGRDHGGAGETRGAEDESERGRRDR